MAVEVPPWLNIDYTKRILRLAEDDNTLQVTNIFTKAATAKGDNYTSDMFRVTVEFTRNNGDKKVTEKKSIIFKLEPLEEGARRELVNFCLIIIYHIHAAHFLTFAMFAHVIRASTTPFTIGVSECFLRSGKLNSSTRRSPL